MSAKYTRIGKEFTENENETGWSVCLLRWFSMLSLLASLLTLPTLIFLLLLVSPSDSDSSRHYQEYKNCTSENILSTRFGHIPAMRHDVLTLPTPGGLIDVPVYMSHNINEPSTDIKYAYIIMHGNLRNGFDYYCAGVDSISSTEWDMSKVALIAPQFFIQNDTCWDGDSKYRINIGNKINCGLPIWSSEGWKDGHLSLTHYVHSYDVFDSLLNRLGDPKLFPNLKFITFFGFSAGGQVVLRYASMPSYTLLNEKTTVRFIVSDPSTFLYLDKQRPYPSSEIEFGIPNADWLPETWEHSAQDGSNWTVSWNTNCESYNHWRYGLDNLSGYAEMKASKDSKFVENLIKDFEFRDITYLLGTKDDVNCKLESMTACDDHELATYCQAMLQGSNRADRMRKWIAYLTHFYGHPIQHIVEAPGIDHDAVAMLHSEIGKCVIFGICSTSSSKPVFPNIN